MEKIWLKSYPKGIPHEIDVTEYDSVRDIFDESVRKYASRPAFTCMGKSIRFSELDTLSSTAGVDAAPSDEASWLHARRSGEWVHMFMQGSWVHAQLLWYGRHREYWLFADGESANTWAIRRVALERLLQMKLLSLLTPRSLIRDAAARVLHHLVAR